MAVRSVLVAGMNVNVCDVSGDIQALIRPRRQVDPARLADPGIPSAELSPPPFAMP